MNEVWESWDPQGQAIYRSSMISVTDDDKGLTITLSNNKLKKECAVAINFYNGADSYTLLQGPFIEKLKTHLLQKYGESFFKESSCFKIRNSLYVEWATTQSYTMIKLPYAQHFCIFTHTLLVHLIAPYEPNIKFLQ